MLPEPTRKAPAKADSPEDRAAAAAAVQRRVEEIVKNELSSAACRKEMRVGSSETRTRNEGYVRISLLIRAGCDIGISVLFGMAWPGLAWRLGCIGHRWAVGRRSS